MNVNMKDVARDLGVSVVTVSKSLRNHPDISKKTRERVLQRVKELGYRPNLTARSLVTGRSSLIGLIVPDLIHPFFADVAKSLSLAMRQHGYFLVIASSEEDPELERQEIENILAHRLDALVVASCQLEADSLRRIQKGNTPLVLVDRFFKDLQAHFVGSDDYVAAKLATEHLLAIGCRRLAHVRGPENSVGTRRLKGFLDTVTRHGLKVPAEYIVPAPRVDAEGQRSGAHALRQLNGMQHSPDGVFCYNDVVAVGLIEEALRLNVKVPDDLAVIGCGNLYFDSQIRVPLSSIDQRAAELGNRTAKLILEILTSDEPKACRDIILQPKLVPRASTARKDTQRTSKSRR